MLCKIVLLAVLFPGAGEKKRSLAVGGFPVMRCIYL